MNHNKIIISLIVLLVASFSFLAYLERTQHKIADKWFLYFENPQDASMNFVIENFSDTENFSWNLIADEDLVESHKLTVLKNKQKNVTIEKLPKGSKLLVKVTQEKEEKEIYKTFQLKN